MNAAIMIQNDTIPEFSKLIGNLSETLTEAGQMLFRMHQKDRDIFQKILAKIPGISANFLSNILRVGEGTLHPQLLLNRNPGYQALKALPFSIQADIIKEGAIELIVDSTSGDAIMVPVIELNPAQIAQVFNRDNLRSKEEQQAWLRRKMKTKTSLAKDDDYPYFVKNGRLIINRPCEFTTEQLAHALAEMQKR
jgi:hypothetical protein